MKRFLGLIFIVSQLTSPISSADDFQTWQWATIDFWNDDSIRLYLYADNRIGDGSQDAYLQILSPRATFKVHPNLDLGIGYAWLNIDPLGAPERFWQHRAEFEVNPKMKSGAWSFHNRNRLELRWKNGAGEPLPRLRNRFQIKYSFEKPVLNSVYFNNEFFTNLSTGSLVENRFTPAGLEFKLTEKTTVSLFYMVQSIDSGSEWNHAHVIGTFLQLKL